MELIKEIAITALAIVVVWLAALGVEALRKWLKRRDKDDDPPPAPSGGGARYIKMF